MHSNARILRLTRDEKTRREETLADLNDTLAEMDAWDTAYKARVQQTDLRRKREQEADPHFPG